MHHTVVSGHLRACVKLGDGGVDSVVLDFKEVMTDVLKALTNVC